MFVVQFNVLATFCWRFSTIYYVLIVHMSQLIRSCKAVTIAPRSIPSLPTSAATAPAEMDHKPVNPVDLVGSWVSQVSASLAS
ncbi:unnamed protein product [Malus baccata var. baccata]